jgi:hypothetical protein
VPLNLENSDIITETIFYHPEGLPVAYLIILTWVVCANVLARLLAPSLINASSGWLRQLLTRPVNVVVTADKVVPHLFERQLLEQVKDRLLFELLGDLGYLGHRCALARQPVETQVFGKAHYPDRYRSGCPPNAG